jgi:hypothetical protein
MTANSSVMTLILSSEQYKPMLHKRPIKRPPQRKTTVEKLHMGDENRQLRTQLTAAHLAAAEAQAQLEQLATAAVREVAAGQLATAAVREVAAGQSGRASPADWRSGRSAVGEAEAAAAAVAGGIPAALVAEQSQLIWSTFADGYLQAVSSPRDPLSLSKLLQDDPPAAVAAAEAAAAAAAAVAVDCADLCSCCSRRRMLESSDAAAEPCVEADNAAESIGPAISPAQAAAAAADETAPADEETAVAAKKLAVMQLPYLRNTTSSDGGWKITSTVVDDSEAAGSEAELIGQAGRDEPYRAAVLCRALPTQDEDEEEGEEVVVEEGVIAAAEERLEQEPEVGEQAAQPEPAEATAGELAASEARHHELLADLADARADGAAARQLAQSLAAELATVRRRLLQLSPSPWRRRAVPPPPPAAEADDSSGSRAAAAPAAPRRVRQARRPGAGRAVVVASAGQGGGGGLNGENIAGSVERAPVWLGWIFPHASIMVDELRAPPSAGGAWQVRGRGRPVGGYMMEFLESMD